MLMYWFKCCRWIVLSAVFTVWSTTTERGSFFIKKTLKKINLFLGIRNYFLLLFSDVIIQTNKLFIFRDLLNLAMKFIGGQIKAFSFLFCFASDVKSTKGGECLYTEWLWNNKQKENRFILCIYAQWKVQNCEEC